MILDAFSKEDNGVYLECDPERLANALKALGILAYEMCDGPSYRLVVDFDEIRHIYNELENQ